LAEETEIPKGPHQDHVENLFDSQGEVHKEFVPEGKTVNAEFYKIVMDRRVVGPCHHGMARPQVADRGTASFMEGSCE